MGIFSFLSSNLKMMKEQRKLIQQGYTVEEASDIVRLRFLFIKYQDMGYSEEEAEKLASDELTDLKSRGI
tara:strand:- start:1668 stop:1877 length:210 start_codon:yes stop_codon:yes gene_type:complete